MFALFSRREQNNDPKMGVKYWGTRELYPDERKCLAKLGPGNNFPESTAENQNCSLFLLLLFSPCLVFSFFSATDHAKSFVEEGESFVLAIFFCLEERLRIPHLVFSNDFFSYSFGIWLVMGSPPVNYANISQLLLSCLMIAPSLSFSGRRRGELTAEPIPLLSNDEHRSFRSSAKRIFSMNFMAGAGQDTGGGPIQSLTNDGTTHTHTQTHTGAQKDDELSGGISQESVRHADVKTNKTHTTHSNNVYQNANKHEKVTLGALGGQLDVWDRGWRTEKRSSLKDSFAPR